MRRTNEPHRFPYLWRLSDGYPAKGIEPHGCKVFGTFTCGGGSSMGYKLAGYDHIGGVELDPSIASIYIANHHPRHFYTMDIRDFNALDNLPGELYDLDLLDGSPPCSTFSFSGEREKAWGKTKQFSEGQKFQRLDDLVFVYCDTIAKLRPKVCLLENVSGLAQGNGKAYSKTIVKKLDEIGYNVQVFLLNSATMGVPQIRERVFFIGLRKDFKLPKLSLNFNERPILFREIKDGLGDPITGERTLLAWNKRIPSDHHVGMTNLRIHGKKSNFNTIYAKDDEVLHCITASCQQILYSEPKKMSVTEMLKGSSFPLDYAVEPSRTMFVCGMSVPPVMTAQISYQIYLQWLKNIKG